MDGVFVKLFTQIPPVAQLKCEHQPNNKGGSAMARSTTSERFVTYAGIDFHKKFSMVALGDENGKLIGTQKLINNRADVIDFFSQFSGLECAIETSRGHEWLVELLQELGLTVHLVNPYKVKLIAESRCKTDKIDSRILMELLAIGYLPTCYQSTPKERALRERLRWRGHLIQSSTRIKTRLRCLLAKENLDSMLPRLNTQTKSHLLKEIKLSSAARQRLFDRHLELLDTLSAMIDRENAWVNSYARKNPDIQLLKTIPGIANFSALVILAELGDISRFKTSDKVVAYAGLAPSVYSSANTRRMGRLTKQGPPLLRWILVQDAWQAIRHNVELRYHFACVSRRCGKQAAIISVARKLLKIAYRVLRDKTPFDASLLATHAKLASNSDIGKATGSAPEVS